MNKVLRLMSASVLLLAGSPPAKGPAALQWVTMPYTSLASLVHMQQLIETTPVR